MPKPNKRMQLVAADHLVYRQGFGQTTLAHIAKHAKAPLGNVYFGQGKSSADLATHLLSALQGAALLSHSFGTTRHIRCEATRLKEVDSWHLTPDK